MRLQFCSLIYAFQFNSMQKITFITFLLFVQISVAQQIDFKDLLRNDTNVINKNTVFNWYWSSFMNKTMKFRHIREFTVHHHGKQLDTIKMNTLAFDTNGRLIRWNTILFKYAFNGSFLGYVDSVTSQSIIPNSSTNKVFTDFHFYSELRENKNNQLVRNVVVEDPHNDSLVVKYMYHPDLYIKSQEIINENLLYTIPEGPKVYLQKIRFYRHKKIVYERFLNYELYED